MKKYIGLKEKTKHAIFESEKNQTKSLTLYTTSFSVPSNQEKTPRDTGTQWVGSPVATAKICFHKSPDVFN